MKRRFLQLLLLALAGFVSLPGLRFREVQAAPALGEWTPLFKGVDHAMGTNRAGGNMPNDHVVYVIRVDLSDPDVRLFTSPRHERYVLNASETGGYTVSDFLALHRLQVAVNAGLFSPQEYYLPAGTPMDIAGLAVSEGFVVSEQEGPDNAATLTFDAANVPALIATNWPATSTAGVRTAVSGSYPLLVNGVNLGAQYLRDPDFIHRTNPRTVMGYSRNPDRLFIVVIDGRQPGYSTGANDFESGQWLAFLGATDGINLDGGGSSTLSVEDTTGQPKRLNRPSAVADSGRERTVGGHFGIFAKPVPGFINDIAVEADDTFATLTWTTTAPSVPGLRYGTDAGLGSRLDAAAGAVPSASHRVLVTGLAPGTAYYFRAVATEGTTEHLAPVRTFVTSNYVSTASLFGVEKEWRYAVQDLDGTAWQAPAYNDAGWPGAGPGLLWVDGRGSARAGVEPASTRLPLNDASGFPYPTYYFRTHFEFPADPAGASLRFTTYIDDGAVVYLNGVELVRLRMEEAPAAISNDALASGFGCSGDATCGEVVEVSAATLQSLQALRRGDNLLAVEVHNYNPRSPDTTFGLAAEYSVPVVIRPTLEISQANGRVTLQWLRSGFVLQEAAGVDGPWVDLPATAGTGSHAVSMVPGARFYRLRKQ